MPQFTIFKPLVTLINHFHVKFVTFLHYLSANEIILNFFINLNELSQGWAIRNSFSSFRSFNLDFNSFNSFNNQFQFIFIIIIVVTVVLTDITDITVTVVTDIIIIEVA